MEDVRYMISEASKNVGVESHTLRYWEEELELTIERNEMGHRYYKDTDIKLLKTIKQLKDQGFQLKAIRMLLPNLSQLESLDNQTMVKLKDELNGKVIEMWENEENVLEDQEEGTSLITSEKKHEIEPGAQDKMKQFKELMNQIIRSALQDNNKDLSENISTSVTDSVVKEMNFLMRLQEEREEERYKKFDATLRDYQRSRMHAAASYESRRKKSKFFKKNNVYI
ncbi:MAG: MerR family transcriptional regulator [Clostridiales bacterium]|jgi:DNA-binding transcriptional MerR regulator|nr:helix-turn-helix domain-containing protein [Bacillota bacterium]NLK04714.1 MerR family transcriptional regulator [Clostridiales bacterium]